MSWTCKVGPAVLVPGIVALGIARAAAQDPGAAPDLETLESRLHATCVRGDAEDAESLRTALAAYQDQQPARVHFLLALTHMAPAMLTNGSPDRRHLEATRAHVDAALAELELARAADPELDRARGAEVLCLWWQFQMGPEDPAALGKRYGELLRAAGEEGAQDPFLQLLRIQSRLSASTAAVDVEAVQHDTLALLDELAGTLEMHGKAPDFLDLLTFGMAARGFLFQPAPRPDLAAEVTEDLLELAPDMKMARDFLVPFGTVRAPLEEDADAACRWTSLAPDPAGDGAVLGLADAVGLEFAPDPRYLWLRILLAAAPPEEAFGVNVVFAAEDPGDSTPWWGGNTELRFDRLATVWVSRDPEGHLRGAVGLAAHAPAFAGEMCQQSDGSVAFAVKRSSPAFVLRIPWSELPGHGPLRFGVAVGSSAQWNDDVPDHGSVEVKRPE